MVLCNNSLLNKDLEKEILIPESRNFSRLSEPMDFIRVLWKIGTDKNRTLVWWNAEGTELSTATRKGALFGVARCCGRLLNYET